MRKCKVIVFTGGCFSGKTTTMEKMKDIFTKQLEIKTEILKEPIRNYPGADNIDELRKDPSKYLEMQETTTYDRYTNLIWAVHKHKNDEIVFLVDRALSDVMFYSTYYLKKEDLSTANNEQFIYEKFLKNVENYAEYCGKEIYDYILEFHPLDFDVQKSEDAKFRPEKINELKWIEHEHIKEWNEKLFKDKAQIDWTCYNHMFDIDLNKLTDDELEQNIISLGNSIRNEWAEYGE